MVGFPKVIKTKADLVNTYKLVKKGRLKKEDWLAAVEKLENQNFIFCPILEKTEDRKGVTVKFICRHKQPCTPSLAAAIGTTACIAVAVPSRATITRGTCARPLVCGACVTVCNLPGWAKAHPIEKYINRG